jgi:hypothetical protein
MITTDMALRSRAALMADHLITTELFHKYGQTADIELVSRATFRVTLREGSRVHVVAGTAKECLAKLSDE